MVRKIFFSFFFSKIILFVEGNSSKQEDEDREKVRSAKILTTTRSYTPYSNSRKQNRNRPQSAKINKDFDSYQFDLTPALTKSALIYQLIRSRIEANLAKSLSNNKELNNI